MRIRPAGSLLVLLLCVSGVSHADPPGAPKGPPPAAPAPAPSYSAELMVLHATNGDKGIDPRIGDMPELKKVPFSSYKSYTLLQRKKQTLKANEEQPYDLPNGRRLHVKLVEALPKDAARVTASINQPGGQTFLPLLEVKAKVGQPFILAGQAYKGGILVLVLRLVK
jgi:hypothetical protein